MIIRRNGSSLLLITQPDHAALAARVMRRWRAGGLPQSPRHAAILLAIEQHDNGWQEVDAAPLVDEATGRVMDFIGAPDGIRRDVWPRAVRRLSAAPYAAALVAQHALHIYRRYRGDRAWAPFFEGMEETRNRHLRQEPPLALDDLLSDYFFVRIGDLISLTFSNGWTDVQSDDSGSGYRIQLRAERLTVAPDPFAGEEVPLQIDARELPDRPFVSAGDARNAFLSARETVLTGVAVGETLHVER